jgi:hypothetical protein
VLKAPEALSYQLAFLSSELQTILALAPTSIVSQANSHVEDEHTVGTRKAIEGDCPICMMELSPDDTIWCKASCGNNVHRECFRQWAASKPGQVRCVYCRTPWQADVSNGAGLQKLLKSGGDSNTLSLNEEGYVNVASELGLSGVRDTTTYHSYWVESQRRKGLL